MISSSQIQQMIEECRGNGRGYRDDQDPRISLEKLAWKDAATALRRVRDCVKRAETNRASYMPNAPRQGCEAYPERGCSQEIKHG